MVSRALLPLLLGTTLLLGSCSTLRDYNRELSATSEHMSAGDINTALALLDEHNPWQEKDLLYYLERGELQRAQGDLIASQLAWRRADRQVFFREEEPTPGEISQYMTHFATVILNDKIRRYEGYDYEKVMLTTQMALNQLALGDFAGARTDIKKTHEREALIATLRDDDYWQLEEQARAQGINLHFQDLQGYPVATLNAPEVLALKNSYQNAFSHYLAGFVYEALGEKTLAAPGYRQAIELRPHTPLLEQALRNLDTPAAKADQGEVLIIVQGGLAPARSSVRLPVVVMIEGEPITSQISFPVLIPDTSTAPITHISVDGRSQALINLDSISAMSRRALHDDMPGIIMRTTNRAIISAEGQVKLRKTDPKRLESYIQYGLRKEDADTRTWRTLPDTTAVVRLRLKKGKHLLSLPGLPPVQVNIDQAYQAVSLRVVANQIFASGLAVQHAPQPD